MKAMMTDGDVVVSKQKIVEFTSCRFLAGGNVAVVTFLEESAFTYKVCCLLFWTFFLHLPET